jgi:hypothetical protein
VSAASVFHIPNYVFGNTAEVDTGKPLAKDVLRVNAIRAKLALIVHVQLFPALAASSPKDQRKLIYAPVAQKMLAAIIYEIAASNAIYRWGKYKVESARDCPLSQNAKTTQR